jgi:GxxExxY protein
MNTDKHRLDADETVIHDALTERIIGCAMQVSNCLGVGYLEKVYENALILELRANGLQVTQQVPVRVWYRYEVIGDYVADLIVENKVLIELKHADGIHAVHVAQSLNYLRATKLKTCLLLNFGTPRLGIKRLSL